MLYQLSYISLALLTLQPLNILRAGFSPRGICLCNFWSGRRESNPRPTAWKAVTLPLSYSRPAITVARYSSVAPAIDSARSCCSFLLWLHVRTANIARIASARQPESLIVDRDPRQHHQHGERAQGHPQPLHSESWCTGEDSNLRSPLGAADLQSAAINHSATCARRAEQNRPARYCQSCYQRATCQAPVTLQQDSAIAARYGCRAKSFWEAAAGVSSLGEFCDLPGLLLLLRLAARSRLQFWSWRRDLNPRPSDYKSDALPAELRQRAAQYGHVPQPSIVLPA